MAGKASGNKKSVEIDVELTTKTENGRKKKKISIRKITGTFLIPCDNCIKIKDTCKWATIGQGKHQKAWKQASGREQYIRQFVTTTFDNWNKEEGPY